MSLIPSLHKYVVLQTAEKYIYIFKKIVEGQFMSLIG